MRDFKKTFIASLSFIIASILFSIAIIEPMMHTEFYSYYDSKARTEYAGSLDYIFNGASHLQLGVNTSIVDQKLGYNSYNLSGSAISWSGRVALLEEEIDRNPIDTVVIELSYNTFSRDDKLEGDLRVIPRLNSFSKRVKFLLNNTTPNSFNTLLGFLLSDGKKWWKKKAVSAATEALMDYENKGYVFAEPKDLTILSEKDIISTYNCSSLSLEFKKENLADFNKMVRLCKERNIKMQFIIIPVSDNMIWEFDNWDEFYENMSSVVENAKGKLYDFNLLKNRYALFNDQESFTDTQHMSKYGATIFSKTYCEVINKINSGKDVSSLFYSSYEEMKADSPYMKIYKNIKK